MKTDTVDIDTHWTLKDLEEMVDQINEPECSSDNQFSKAFMDSSYKLAQKLANQANEENTEEAIKKLAQILASYED